MSRIIRKVENKEKIYYDFSFYKDGIASFKNDSLFYINENEDSLFKISPYFATTAQIFESPYPISRKITETEFSIIYQRKINIENVLYDLKDPIGGYKTIFYKGDYLSYSDTTISKLSKKNNTLEDSIIFRGNNIIMQNTNDILFQSTENSKIVYYKIENNKIQPIEEQFSPLKYGGQGWEDGQIKIKNGYSPFTGGGFVNYTFVVNLSDNSYYNISELSSFQYKGLGLQDAFLSKSKTSNGVTIIHTYSNKSSDNEGFLSFDTNEFTWEFSSYKVLKKLSPETFLVLNNKDEFGKFDNKLSIFTKYSSIVSNPLRDTIFTDFSNYSKSSGILQCGKEKIIVELFNNPFELTYEKEKNAKKVEINYNFKKYTLTRDSIIAWSLDKEYTIAENRLSVKNSLYFFKKYQDTLWFYNSNTKKSEFIIDGIKSNQHSLNLFYLENNEIQILVDQTLLILKDKKVVKFRLPEYAKFFHFQYLIDSNELFFLYLISRFSSISERYSTFKSCKVSDNILKEFTFKSDPNISFFNGIGISSFNSSKIIIDLKKESVKNVFSGVTGGLNLNFVYQWKNFQLFFENSSYDKTTLRILNSQTNRNINFHIPGSSSFKYLWAEDEFVYYLNGRLDEIFRLNLENFEISKLQEKIKTTSQKYHALIIEKEDGFYLVSTDLNKIYTNINFFYGNDFYEFPNFDIDGNKEFVYFLILNSNHPQLYKTENLPKRINSLKWIVTETIDANELYSLEEFVISVFPNPAYEKVKIISNQAIKNIEIFDMHGKQLLNKPIILDLGYQEPLIVNNQTASNEINALLYGKNSQIFLIKFTFQDNSTYFKKLISIY
ncbi:T9SS type A sorting domain-containing protein [Lacihabitans sp. LS3-19]|uniref:T9SS type A sorting domain-containing protein n=1 Tax=Lacihabitans sp. LS3-19 TaxID=2487335 RepID=UPI0020CDB568|nr:T9SS type A sorting domain-containing protein [Lacihabitans sp. LS3-19]